MKYYVYNKETKAWSTHGVDLKSIPREQKTDDLYVAPVQADGTAGKPVLYKELVLELARKQETVRQGIVSKTAYSAEGSSKLADSPKDPAKAADYTFFLVRVVCWTHIMTIITGVLIGLSILILSLSHAKHPEVGAFIGLALGALLSWVVYAKIRSRFE